MNLATDQKEYVHTVLRKKQKTLSPLGRTYVSFLMESVDAGSITSDQKDYLLNLLEVEWYDSNSLKRIYIEMLSRYIANCKVS